MQPLKYVSLISNSTMQYYFNKLVPFRRNKKYCAHKIVQLNLCLVSRKIGQKISNLHTYV